MEEIRGEIERITYSNEENGYAVIKVKVSKQKELVTVVGNIIGVSPGEVLRMKGEWVTHSKFGEQLKVTHYRSEIPATIVGIERYLGSGLIKGIGKHRVGLIKERATKKLCKGIKG